jgi:adenine phosphoribosyltransferase
MYGEKQPKMKKHIPVWPDWPIKGVNFIDITGILVRPDLFNQVIKWYINRVEEHDTTSIVAIESRGFIFGSAVASKTNLPLILVRKPNKLPGELKTVSYDTEYSKDSLSMQVDSPIGQRPYIIDDLLATGGTLLATEKLLDREHTRSGVVINLSFLPGHTKIKNLDYYIEYTE